MTSSAARSAIRSAATPTAGCYGEWAPGNNWRPVTLEDYGQIAKEVVALGYDALKFNPFFAPADADWPDNERILDPRRADLGFERVAAVRDAVGPDVDIMVEVHGWLGPTSAIEMGRRLVELKPYFYEEPVDAMNVECMRKVSENVPIPAGRRRASLHPLPVPRVHRRPGGGYSPARCGAGRRHHRAEKDRRLRRDLRPARAAAQLPRAHRQRRPPSRSMPASATLSSRSWCPSATRSPTIWSTNPSRWMWSRATCRYRIGRAWAFTLNEELVGRCPRIRLGQGA